MTSQLYQTTCNLRHLGVALLLSLFCINSWAHGFMEADENIQQNIEFPPIEEDIQALSQYGNKARLAGKRLVEQGELVLGLAHDTILQPGIPFPQTMQLVTVLGEIANPGSVDVILEVADDSSNHYLYQNTLLSLAKFEQTDDIVNFVNLQLEDTNTHPLILRSALGYYALQPHAEAERWVKQYGDPTASKDVRFAALYLGGTLGIDSIKDDIVDLLHSKQGIARQYYLLLGLAEIVSVDEF